MQRAINVEAGGARKNSDATAPARALFFSSLHFFIPCWHCVGRQILIQAAQVVDGAHPAHAQGSRRGSLLGSRFRQHGRAREAVLRVQPGPPVGFF